MTHDPPVNYYDPLKWKCGSCQKTFPGAAPAGYICDQCQKAPPDASTPTLSALQQQIGGSHYRSMKIQPIEFCHANGIGFAEGAIIKYVCRHRQKNGRADLLKARHLIDLLIELEYDKQRKATGDQCETCG